jgi:hypothetical protein
MQAGGHKNGRRHVTQDRGKADKTVEYWGYLFGMGGTKLAKDNY